MIDGFLSPVPSIGSSALAVTASAGFTSILPIGISASSIGGPVVGFIAPVFPFGIASALSAEVTIEEAVMGAQVDQVFAQDYGGAWRRCTAADYRRFCKLRKLMKSCGYGFTVKGGRVQHARDRLERERADEQALCMMWALLPRNRKAA